MKRQLTVAFLMVLLTAATALAGPINSVAFGNMTVSQNGVTIISFAPPPGTMTASLGSQPATVGTYYYWGHTPTENAGVGAGTAAASDGIVTLTTTETNGGGTQYLDLYPSQAMASDLLVLSFDLAVLTNPGPVEPGSESDLYYNGATFGMNIFAGGSSAARFIAAPTSLTGGTFGLSSTGLNNGVENLSAQSSYVNGEIYHVTVTLDFASRDAALSIDSNPVGTTPFRNPSAGDTLSEVFAYQVGYAVPDSGATLTLLGCAVVGIGALRRKLCG